MKYHAPTRQFTVSQNELQRCASTLFFAIKKIRQVARLAMEGGERQSAMTDACHAEQAVLEAGRQIVIDLGATRAGGLNVRSAA